MNDSSIANSKWMQALLPGMELKRWLLLMFLGVTVMGLGFAFLIREAYITNQFPDFVYMVALRFLPDWLRGLLLLGCGLTILCVGIWRVSRTIVNALLSDNQPHTGQPPKNQEVVNVLLQHRQRRQRRQGPKIVAIGGGTGMPQLLRGLRAYTDNITAIVTVADDGGSSGRLRRQMRMLPPGDFRNNIAALSDAEELMTRLFQYRFANTDVDGNNELAGHSFGNLFITTMAAVTGSFEMGIAESSRVLAVQGRVLPSTLEQITLCAEICQSHADGTETWQLVEGESNIPDTDGQVMRVFLKPEQVSAYPEAIQAILHADLIVASPGSFFTSILPNLLVPAIRDAIIASSAPCIYLCNVATQPGETDGYTLSDHMHQLRQHAGDAFTAVLANHTYDVAVPPSPFGQWVTLPEPDEITAYQLFTGDLVNEQRPWHHDPGKLAARLMAVYEELRTAQYTEQGHR